MSQNHPPGGTRQEATAWQTAAEAAATAIALDGGSTTLRARRIELRGGRIVGTARRAIGAADFARGGSTTRLRAAVLEAIAELDPEHEAIGVVASGMLTSELGLEAVPHVSAPAGVKELAAARVVRSWPELSGRPLVLVPGVRTPHPESSRGDMMRGEECETLGAWHALGCPSGERLFLWPGSHTKLVGLDAAGRIAWSHTTLAGEIWSALARGTILAAALGEEPPSEPWDEAEIARGSAVAVARGLGRAAFAVRLDALHEAPGRVALWSFWLGAVIGDDVASLARAPSLLAGECPIHVGGRQPQRGIYSRLLEEVAPGRVDTLSESFNEGAAAWGALRVAGWLGSAGPVSSP